MKLILAEVDRSIRRSGYTFDVAVAVHVVEAVVRRTLFDPDRGRVPSTPDGHEEPVSTQKIANICTVIHRQITSFQQIKKLHLGDIGQKASIAIRNHESATS